MNYFYDKQIRQHLVQFIRMFSNFSVQIGESENGDPIYRTVPAKYGDPTRMAAAIMRENSENKMLSVPQITVYITNINMAPDKQYMKKNSIKPQVITPLMQETVIKLPKQLQCPMM